MRKIVEDIASSLVRNWEERDIYVFNEAIIRSVLYVLCRGFAPKYGLNISQGVGKKRYSFDIDLPGDSIRASAQLENFTTLSRDSAVIALREDFAAVALQEGMYSPTGENVLLGSLCRYMISIYAFMPEHARELTSSIQRCNLGEVGEGYVNAIRYVKKKIEDIFEARQVAPKLWLDWGQVYGSCYGKLYAAGTDLTDEQVARLAHAIFTSKPCVELNRMRDDLIEKISGGVIPEKEVFQLAMQLGLLSNFKSEVSEGFDIHMDSVANLRGKKRRFSLHIQREKLLDSLKSSDWPHVVRDKVNSCISEKAPISIEMLLIASMLFGSSIGITGDKIDGIRLFDGNTAFSFSTDFSFPLVKEESPDCLKNGKILEDESAMDLVDLLIESHHTRQRCSFPVSYEKVPKEIRQLTARIETGELRRELYHAIKVSIFRNSEPSEEQRGSLIRLANAIEDRLLFLQKFTESPEYDPLADFLKKSNPVDNRADFIVYMKIRNQAPGQDMESVSKRRKKAVRQCARIFSETMSALVLITGVVASYVALHDIRTGSGVVASLPIGKFVNKTDLLIVSSAVIILGFMLLAISWMPRGKRRAAVATSGITGSPIEIDGKVKDCSLFVIPCKVEDLCLVGFMPDRRQRDRDAGESWGKRLELGSCEFERLGFGRGEELKLQFPALEDGYDTDISDESSSHHKRSATDASAVKHSPTSHKKLPGEVQAVQSAEDKKGGNRKRSSSSRRKLEREIKKMAKQIDKAEVRDARSTSSEDKKCMEGRITSGFSRIMSLSSISRKKHSKSATP